MPLRRLMRSTQAAYMLSAAAVVALLWLPFGFQLGGNIEEWDILSLFSRHGLFFWAGADSPVPFLLLRPLTLAPHAIAFALDPDSFVFWHVLLMLSLLIKGWSAATIVSWMTRSRRWAVFFGMLVVLYPADTMQLSFRALHINFSVALILLASVIQLKAFEKQSIGSRLLLQAAAAFCLITASLMYEAALFLTPIPVLIVVMRPDAWRQLWTQRWPLLTWVLMASLCALRLGYTWFSADVYQIRLAGSRSLVGIVVERLPSLFS